MAAVHVLSPLGVGTPSSYNARAIPRSDAVRSGSTRSMIGAIERADQRELADAVAGDSVAIEGGPCMLQWDYSQVVARIMGLLRSGLDDHFRWIRP